MARSASIIEINGMRYDASTGKVIGTVKKAAQAVHQKQVIDGIVRPKAAQAARSLRQATKKPAQSVHRKTQHSRTLMRKAVSQPRTKPAAAAIQPAPKKRSMSISSVRAFRAKTTAKHQGVSRFGALASGYAKVIKSQPSAVSGEVIPKNQPTQALAVAQPAAVSDVPSHQLERMLDHALARADAHKRALRESKRWRIFKKTPRWLAAAIVLGGVLLAGGFLAWNKIPQLSLKVAASKAQINATVPAYTPSGYDIAGPVKFQEGVVKAKFTAKSDDHKTFTVIQESSNMDSASLAETTIPKNTPVQTSQVKGTTVYIFGQNNDATWVNKGIKYTIKNDAKLPSDELLKTAGSL